MNHLVPNSFLRRVLSLDAASCALLGAVSIAGARPLGEVLALAPELLRGVGLVLLPCAAYLLWLARRSSSPTLAVWAAIVLNGAWVAQSVLLLLTKTITPNALGIGFVLLQALAVAVFAELEFVGLKRSAAALSPA